MCSSSEMEADLEKLYRGMYWSKRFNSPADVINDHFRFIKEESDRMRATIPFETVVYGRQASESLDLFGTDLPNGLYTWNLIPQ